MSLKPPKQKDNSWRKKAIERNAIIKKQSKRIKELTASRDSWKQKCKKKKSVNSDTICLDTSRAAGHHYPIQMVLLMVLWQEYGRMSLRSVRHCFAGLQMVFALNCRVPSHVSIRNWVCKSGYYRIEKERNSLFDSNEKWVFIIDESIAIGSEKLLLILGLPLSKYSFSKSLSKEDVRVLYVGVAKEWKAQQISKRLEALATTHNVSYVVSDSGNNLKSALRLSSLPHIPDCTHVIANALERQYKKDSGYVSLSIAAGALRRKWFLSGKKVVYMPPIQRSKARFQNIFPTIEWADNIVAQWENIPQEIQLELGFVKQEEALVKEMFEQITLINALSKTLKNEGLNTNTKKRVQTLMKSLRTPRGLAIKAEINNYLTLLSPFIEKEKTILCCSDIIESYFGKFKNKINPKSPNGMTEFVLTIANFCGAFDKEEIKESLEKVKCEDLKNWNKNKTSLTKERQKIFAKNGTKKAA